MQVRRLTGAQDGVHTIRHGHVCLPRISTPSYRSSHNVRGQPLSS
jgi:hypothetical protein